MKVKWKKLKSLETCRIWYFELEIFSFNLYVYYLTHGLIASTCAFNLLLRAFNLPTRNLNLATRAFSLLTGGFELVTRGFELVIHGFELVTRGFKLVTRISNSQFVTLVLLFHIYVVVISFSFAASFLSPLIIPPHLKIRSCFLHIF